MPLETIENFRDHGRVRLSIEDNVPQAKAELAALEDVGIHYDQVTQQLQDEGVQKFADSFHELFKEIEAKRQALKETLHAGRWHAPVGAGHFVKMVHNGIAYGMLHANVEGFEILNA